MGESEMDRGADIPRQMISIVVPVYGVEAYLDQTVRSVINQSWPNWELILVDDGSPDKSGELCDIWAGRDARIQVIHQKNGGLSAARNAGRAKALGDWLTFLDGDDWWEESFLEEMLSEGLGHRAELVLCGWIKEYEGRPDLREVMTVPSGVISGREALSKLYDPNGVLFVTACNRLYKRSLWSSLIFPEGKLHEDEFTAHRILDGAERVCVMDRPLYHYRQRGESITNSIHSPRSWDGVEALLDRCAYFRERGYARLEEPAFRSFLHYYLKGLAEAGGDGREHARIRALQQKALPLLEEKIRSGGLGRKERLALEHPFLWQSLHHLKNRKE